MRGCPTRVFRLIADEDELALKRFRLSADQIKSLVPNRGSCLASDRVTVDGARLCYMYRETGDNDLDSGWRFLCGDESEIYVANPGNFELYDVNTIANYSPDIVEFLDIPGPCAFVRDEEGRWSPLRYPTRRPIRDRG